MFQSFLPEGRIKKQIVETLHISFEYLTLCCGGPATFTSPAVEMRAVLYL
jgi:hypothetical protein